MAYTANKHLARAKRRIVDFDPDGTSEVVATLDPANSAKCLPIAEAAMGIVAGLMRTVGTGSVSAFRIFVADDAAGTVNAANVVSHTLGTAPDAVGDTIWLEATAEQLRAASATAKYVGVKAALATGTDECAIYVEAHGRVNEDGLTSDYIA